MKARARIIGAKTKTRPKTKADTKATVKAKSAAPRRTRAKAPALTEARILEVALTQVQLHGAEALSMRALAKTLGISVMGLYHHVPSKEVLLDRLWGIVLARVPQLQDDGDWGVNLREHAVAAVRLLANYPGLFKHGISRPLTPIALSFGKRTSQVLGAAGFDAQTAALATWTFHMYLLGTVVATELFNDLLAARKAGREVDLEALDVPRVGSYAAVEFGADALVAGLRAQLRA